MTATIVLVHGAFAESASWDGVIDPLLGAGHRVIAAANPLRSLAADAAAVADIVRTVDGPVVLAGHSYGGAVISNVPADAGEIAG
ncbi:MAG: alpha/beta fold hydrolase, partial [Dehalococcoidia bacterium]